LYLNNAGLTAWNQYRVSSVEETWEINHVLTNYVVPTLYNQDGSVYNGEIHMRTYPWVVQGEANTTYFDDFKFTVESPTTELVYTPEIKSSTHYYPFGMQIEEYSFTPQDGGYRYGFNGQEKDDEAKGVGNAYDFGGRSLYDGRLARFISVDPDERIYPFMSPYCYAANNPVILIDKDGRGPQVALTSNPYHSSGKRYNFKASQIQIIEFIPDVNLSYQENLRQANQILRAARLKWQIQLLQHEYASFPVEMGGHEVLDLMGLVPVVGEIFDVVNGIWYASEGDALNASLSMSSAIPALGYFATGSKLSLKGAKALKYAKGLERAALAVRKNADRVWAMNPLKRGKVIERTLALLDYKGWDNVGELLYGYFPTIDFWKDNMVVSMKSISKVAIDNKAFQGILDNMDELSSAVFRDPNGEVIEGMTRIIDVVVEKGTDRKLLQPIFDRAAELGNITVKITEF
jgi:RHS repeat-associated protein